MRAARHDRRMPGSLRRRRSTDSQAETRRLAASLASTLGAEMRRERRRVPRTQRRLADLLGVDQSRVSQLERGAGANAPLELWVGVGVALGRPLAVSLTKPADPTRSVADAGHLQIQEALLALAAATGRRAVAELPTRPLNPTHSIDVALWDEPRRTLIIQEAWNTFGDIGAAIRSTHRKQAEAADLAIVLARDDRPTRVAVVWVVRASDANRALLARYPHLFATEFDGSSRAWAAAIASGTAPPDQPGLVWFDPATRRITAWRRR